MTKMTLVDRLADINFGLPEDLAPHRKPWAYYEILGVPRDASEREIRIARRRVSRTVHPDLFGGDSLEATQRQRLVNDIVEVLLDNCGELGPQYSRRAMYDQMSHYTEYFGTISITHSRQKTKTIAENLFDVLKIEKREAQEEHHFKTKQPDIADLLEKVKAVAKKGDHYTAQSYHHQVVEKLATKEGVSVEEFIRKQKEMFEEHQKQLRERQARNYGFQTRLSEELKAEQAIPLTAPKSEPQVSKVFDIWYNGQKAGFSTVTFGNSNYPYCSVVGFEETETMVRMGLKDGASLSGMRKVHFKAEYANVRITDAYLEGIFQIVNGRVAIEYKSSSYGAVIRARAPTVTNSEDFIREGELYVPKAFATEGWKERTPAVDIAVFDGSVDLRMERIEVQPVRDKSLYNYNPIISGWSNILRPIIEDIGIIKKW